MPFASLDVDILVRIDRPRCNWIDLPEAQNAEACEHCSACERSLALGIHLTQRSEDVICVGTSLSELTETMCKNVETSGWISKPRSRVRYTFTHEKYAQEFRVRVRVDVPPGFHVQELAKVLGVHKVAVDAHGESEGRVDVKGLRLRPAIQTSVSDT